MIEIYYGWNEVGKKEEHRYHFLSEYRQKKADACATAEARSQSIMAGYLLEKQLRNAGIQGEISYGKSPRNKPVLTNRNLAFSLSHCRKISVSVVSPIQVGIDAEQIGRGKKSIAERFFHPAEITLLENLPENTFQRIFTVLWTAKEAMAKCLDVPLVEICQKVDCSRQVFSMERGEKIRGNVEGQEIFLQSFGIEDIIITCATTNEEDFSLKRIDK